MPRVGGTPTKGAISLQNSRRWTECHHWERRRKPERGKPSTVILHWETRKNRSRSRNYLLPLPLRTDLLPRLVLIHLSRSILFENVVWFYDTFEDKSRIIHALSKYLEVSFSLCPDGIFLSNYIQHYAFVREFSLKLSVHFWLLWALMG